MVGDEPEAPSLLTPEEEADARAAMLRPFVVATAAEARVEGAREAFTLAADLLEAARLLTDRIKDTAVQMTSIDEVPQFAQTVRVVERLVRVAERAERLGAVLAPAGNRVCETPPA